MTFSLNMENASRSDSMSGELAKSGQDSAKINLRSVAYKYALLLSFRAFSFHSILIEFITSYT